MFRTCGLLEQNVCATLIQGDYTWALPRTHWIWVTRWSKPERLIQRQLCLLCFVLFLHTAKQMCTYIFLGEDSSVIVLWMDTWKVGKWASPASHLPFTALQAAGKPKAGIRRTGFWVRQSWPWILVPPVTLWPWAQERSLIILPTPWLLGGLNEIMLEKSWIAASNTFQVTTNSKSLLFVTSNLIGGKTKLPN